MLYQTSTKYTSMTNITILGMDMRMKSMVLTQKSAPWSLFDQTSVRTQFLEKRKYNERMTNKKQTYPESWNWMTLMAFMFSFRDACSAI